MKKFIKGCAWLAVFLLIAGIVLSFTASTQEGADAMRRAVDRLTNGRVELDMADVEQWGEYFTKFEGEVNYDPDAAMIFSEDYEVLSGDIKESFPITGVTGLRIEVGGCKFSMEESADAAIHVKAEDTKKFQCYMEEGTLIVRGTIKAGSEGRIVLQLPGDAVFSEINMELGAGAMKLGSLCAEHVSLKAGAGQITAEDVRAESFTAEVGMGALLVSDMQVGELDAEVGMGKLQTEGSVSQKAALQCSMGNIIMKLTEAEKDYDYSIVCGMGQINIGEQSYKGLATEKMIDNGTSRRMKVGCAVGNVSIQFQE